MVHSTFAQGHVMGCRDTSPLGIPKSPSFHSGLDLVASASVDSFVPPHSSTYIENETNSVSFKFNEPNNCIFTRKNYADENLRLTFKNEEKEKMVPMVLQLPVIQRNENAVRVLQRIGPLKRFAGDFFNF